MASTDLINNWIQYKPDTGQNTVSKNSYHGIEYHNIKNKS